MPRNFIFLCFSRVTSLRTSAWEAKLYVYFEFQVGSSWTKLAEIRRECSPTKSCLRILIILLIKKLCLFFFSWAVFFSLSLSFNFITQSVILQLYFSGLRQLSSIALFTRPSITSTSFLHTRPPANGSLSWIRDGLLIASQYWKKCAASRVPPTCSLPEIRDIDIDQISSALNFKNGCPRLQRIVRDNIKKIQIPCTLGKLACFPWSQLNKHCFGVLRI